MNRRLFLAALVSAVSAKVFPQRAAADTRVSGKFISCSVTDSRGWEADRWEQAPVYIYRKLDSGRGYVMLHEGQIDPNPKGQIRIEFDEPRAWHGYSPRFIGNINQS